MYSRSNCNMAKFNWILLVTMFTMLVASAPLLVRGRVCCNHRSKLAYNAYDGAVTVGACGYGSSASTLYGGNVAAVSPSFYRNGVGCSACYQIRCLDPKLCSLSGTKIVATDLTTNSQTDFVVPKSTFSNLALPQMAPELLKAGILDIEYTRIFCEYPTNNLTVKVDESSQYPHYLALEFLYQGGQTDIVEVDVAKMDGDNWRELRRKNGAVWDISNPPMGDIQFRILVTSGFDGYWLWAKRSVLPSRWTSGSLYDCGLQINQTDLGSTSGCYTC